MDIDTTTFMKMSLYTSYSASEGPRQKSDFNKNHDLVENSTPKALNSKSVYDVNPQKSSSSGNSNVLNIFIIFDFDAETSEVSILDCNKLSLIKKRRIDYVRSFDKFITDLKLFIASSIENMIYKF